MVENGQLNLLFIDIKGGYVEPAAVNTEGRDMREVVLEVTRAFYTEAYTRIHIFRLRVNLYKTRAPLFIQWHSSDPLTAAPAQKYLQSVAMKRIVVTFNRGKRGTN